MTMTVGKQTSLQASKYTLVQGGRRRKPRAARRAIKRVFPI